MRILKNILVTGGAGFIGSNFIHYLLGLSGSDNVSFKDACFDGRVVNVDCLTYAGNLENLKDVEETFGGTRYFFEKKDICDRSAIEEIFRKYEIDTVFHFAAETHVDRSVLFMDTFIRTNVTGTFNLLDVARKSWMKEDGSIRDDVLFHHISTDEVYGTLDETGFFTEDTAYNPRSPYSATKASSDHIVMSFFHTYGLPVTISHCTNNYGPYQFPEKFMPLMILNIKAGKNLPVYGDGNNIRDWIYVEDHNRAVWKIAKDGKPGEKYNIGGENEWQNIKLLDKIIDIEYEILTEKGIFGLKKQEIVQKIIHIKDRQGHDFRYATDCSKIKKEIGWEKSMKFEDGLKATIQWYLDNDEWISHIVSGEYRNWISLNYNSLEC